MTDDQSLQAAIHERVSLRPHDPNWARLFEAERARLQALFPGRFIAIEHMGSTAVPGLQAKPVIDLIAGVDTLDGWQALSGALCAAGYTTSAEFNASLTDRKWFMRWADGHRTHHLNVVVHGGPVWREWLGFRDRLRADAALASRYQALKQRLAAEHADDREAYTDAKAGFIREALAEAPH